MVRKVDPNIERTQWTDKEILAVKFPPVEWIIPKILPVGLTLLVGRPFSGKSFLALQIANAVNHGGMLFGEQARKGKVLYIAAEDRNDQLQERMKAQRWIPTGNVDIFTAWQRFKKGGMEDLRKQLKGGDYTLCVVDTLYKLLSGSKNEKDGEMEPVMSELHDMSKRGLVDAMLPLDHSNKLSVTQGEAGEASISGDTAKAGVADSFLMLWKKQGSKQMYFHAEGRMMRPLDLEIKFDEVTCAWQVLGKGELIASESVKGKVLSELKQNPNLTQNDLILRLGKPQSLIARVLKQLVEDGLLERLPREGVKVFFTFPVSKRL